MTSFSNAFKESCCFRISESQRMIAKALNVLPSETLWVRPNDNSNSVGNQLLHLKGNVTQYILSSLGNTPDQRQRDLEFDTQGGLDVTTLWQALDDTLNAAKKVIKNCPEERLLATHSVQGFSLTGIDIAIHAVEHLSYHTGQIAFWVKQQTQQPLGFYDGMDLNLKNQNKC